MEEPTKTYSIEKLNESNYRSWSQVIESHLDDQELWEATNGTAKAPTAPTRYSNDGMVKEDKEGKEADYIVDFPLCHDLRRRDKGSLGDVDDSRRKAQPKSNVTLRQLQRQFNTTKMTDDDGDMEKHIQKVERLKRQIEEQGEEISNSSYISVLLNCAPSRYDVQISIFEAQDDVTPTIIINRLLEEYRKFLSGRPEEKKMALLTNQGGRANQKGGKSKSGLFNNLVLYHSLRS